MSNRGWNNVINAISSSQSSCDELTEELISVSDSEEIQEQSAFWVPLFFRHTGDFHIPQRTTPITLVSACTGSFAEASVLKDGFVPHRA